MAFAQKVDALRRYLGVPTSLQMMPAVVLMNETMGIIGEGPLPGQIEALLIATGIESAPPAAAPAAAAAPATPAPAAVISAAKGGKRKAAAEATPPLDKKQRTLFAMLPTAPKIKVPSLPLPPLPLLPVHSTASLQSGTSSVAFFHGSAATWTRCPSHSSMTWIQHTR
jgi:nucleoid-associated protein YgaU